MRYAGQSYELPVAADELDAKQFTGAFHVAHRERYGHSDPSRTVEIVNLRVKLVLPSQVVTGPVRRRKRSAGGSPLLSARRDVWFPSRSGRGLPTAVYERDTLAIGHAFDGPAVVVQMDSTAVVNPGWRATVDAGLNLALERTTSRGRAP